MASGKIVGAALFVVLAAAIGGGVWMVLQDPADPLDDPGTGNGGEAHVEPDGGTPKGAGTASRKSGDKPLEVVPEVIIDRKLPPVELKEPVDVADSPTFTYEGYGSALNNIPWNETSHLFFRLNRDLPRMALAWTRVESPEQEVFDRVQADFIRLAQVFGPFADSFDSVSGLSAIGHPAAAANVLSKTLEASGVPLDEKQTARIDELARSYIEQDKARREALREDAVWIRRAESEMRLRVGCLDAMRDLLTDRQKSAVGGGSYAHRTGLDPFSPTVVLRDKLMPLDCAGTDVEINMATDTVVGWMGMGGSRHRDEVYTLVEDWLAKLPAGVRNYRQSTVSVLGSPSLERALVSADITASLFERVLAEIDLQQPQSMMLRAMDRAFNPRYVEFR